MGADEYLVVDQGYPLTNKVLVPYRNNGHLTNSQRYFNQVLSQCRATVERLNGLLKLRMQRLGKLFTKSIVVAYQHIAASAIIYNFILLEEEEMDGMVFEDQPQIDVLRAMDASTQDGHRKRENLRANFEAVLAQYDDDD
ncbi:Protein ALP1-like [Frankliniella fusca]|uniref:Protein ALP1-like n=1 Tax=Frankliniella fusca TaxID=407009 RepID=A0AAE1HBZ3_9NEOP|nr:Protein ALP1-like [Frankliniella fusca]